MSIRAAKSELASARRVLEKYIRSNQDGAECFVGMSPEEISSAVRSAHIMELRYMIQSLEWIVGTPCKSNDRILTMDSNQVA